MTVQDDAEEPDRGYWEAFFGPGDGRMAWRSAPLTRGGPSYWHAAARIRRDAKRGGIAEARLALKDAAGVPRRLAAIEDGLVAGIINDADEVLDAVRDLVECADDADGSAAAKSYLAGWICADVVGRCLA